MSNGFGFIARVTESIWKLSCLMKICIRQCCDLETMVSSALEFILSRSRSRDLMAKVLVSRPEVQGLGLGLKTACLVPMPVARLL